MTNDLNNSKLTAYALGELSEKETKEIEKLMEQDSALREEIESIKSFALLMKSELASEPLPNLQTDKIEKLVASVASKKSIFSGLSIWNSPLKGMAGIAFILVVCFVGLQQLNLLSPDLQGGAEITEMDSTNNKYETQEQVAPAEGKSMEFSEKSTDSHVQTKAKTERNKSMAYSKEKTVKTAKKGRAATRSNKVNPESVGLLGAYGRSSGAGDFAESIAGSAMKRKRIARYDYALGGRTRFAPESEASVASVYKNPLVNPLSTFSVDVDTASYTNSRRYLLNSNVLPPRHYVRTEEFINYFKYTDPIPTSEHPFSVNLELTDSPWNKGYQLVRVALKGKAVVAKERKKNLVFLIDTSGSMAQTNKLPLLKDGLGDLLDNLNENDKISIVAYAGSAGVKLEPTSGDQKKKILQSLNNLHSGGGTNGAAGIEEAYRLAKRHFVKDGVNRVILATDGDFNVGMSSQADLKKLIKEKAKMGIDLTVLGFGSGNFRDGLMEEISNQGNGNYYFIDSDREARKVLVDGFNGTLVTIAKDVKLQVEFNPNYVQGYRLIGYNNRRLKDEDFNNDRKDAGDIGAGHSVVALYEIIPQGFKVVDNLKYQATKVVKLDKSNPELLTVKLRYKKPKASKSILLERTIEAKDKKTLVKVSKNFKWTLATASFAELLSGAESTENLNYNKVLELSKGLVNDIAKDSQARQEFVDMVKKARRLQGKR